METGKQCSFQNRAQKAEKLNLAIYDKEDSRLTPVSGNRVARGNENRIVEDTLIYELRGKIHTDMLLEFPSYSYQLKRDEKYTVVFRYGSIKSNVILLNPA